MAKLLLKNTQIKAKRLSAIWSHVTKHGFIFSNPNENALINSGPPKTLCAIALLKECEP
jgi:hypothetical protein